MGKNKNDILNNKLKNGSVSLILPIVFFYFFTYIGNSQITSLYGIDISNYPVIKANFFAFNSFGEQVDISDSDIRLFENSSQMQFKKICPAKKPPKKISSVLTFDISGSMIGAGIAAAQSAARIWVNNLPNESEWAITSFNDYNYLNQDFTKDQNKLQSAINSLKAGGGTNFDKGFLLEPAGALQIAERGQYERVIVFLTDGEAYCDTTAIINKAKDLKAIIYCVVYNTKAPDILKSISRATGGKCFDDISTEQQAKAAFRTILQIAEGIEPCTIEWKTSGCDERRIATFTSLGYDDASSIYTVPSYILPRIDISPDNSLNFGKVLPGNPKTLPLTITAKNDTITIKSISYSNPSFRIINFGGSPPTFTLPPDSSRILQIQYSANDSNINFCHITIESNACSGNEIYAKGGSSSNNQNQPLMVIFPDGKERLPVGSDTLIKWDGVLPTDTVALEYSKDGGDNWQIITESATNLNYLWRVPSTPSQFCKMRVRSIDYGTSRVKLLAGHKGIIKALAWSPDGTELASGDDVGVIKIWNTITGKELKTLDSIVGTVTSLSWSPDGKRLLSNGKENKIYIWDVNSFSVIKELSEHDLVVQAISWSHNGNYFATGGNDGKLIIWNSSDFSIKFKTQAHNASIFSLSWSWNDSMIATGSWDKTSKIYRLSDSSIALTTPVYSKFIYSVGISPNNKYLAIASDDTKLYLWDILEKKQIDAIQAHSKTIYSIGWSPDGKYLATASDDASVKLWEVPQFTEYYKYSGHSDGVKILAWNSDGSSIATGSYDTMIETWSPKDIPLDIPIVQQDESNEFWEIKPPSIRSLDIDLGNVIIGGTKDTVVNNFIFNNGSIPVRIDSVVFTGANLNDFDITPFRTPFSLQMSRGQNINIRFKPQMPEGKKTITVNIYSQNDTLHQTIRGNAVKIPFEIQKSYIDFGKVLLGNYRDTTVALIKNNSSNDIRIDSTVMLGPEKFQYKIESGGGSFILKKGDARQFKISFSPLEAARKQGFIGIYYNGKDSISAAKIELFGEGIDYQLLMNSTVIFPQQLCISDSSDILLDIQNIGTEAITISSSTITGDNPDSFTLIEPYIPDLIAANETVKAGIRFYPLKDTIHTAKLEIKSHITPSDERTSVIFLSGRKDIYRLVFSNDTLDIGSFHEFSQGSNTFTIMNTGTLPINWTVPINLTDFIIDSIHPPQTAPNGGKSIAFVKFKGGKENTNYQETYNFKDSCGNNNFITFKAKVMRNQPELTSINNLNFQLLLCGSTPKDTVIKLKSTGRDALIVESAVLSGLDSLDFNIPLPINNMLIPPEKEDSIKISFTPSSPGEKQTSLIIKSNSINAINGITTIPIAAESEVVHFKLSNNIITFDNVEIGREDSNSITIINDGTFPLYWNFPVNLNYFTLEEIKPPITVPNGGSSVVTVKFKGGAASQSYNESYVFSDTCGHVEELSLHATVAPQGYFSLGIERICGYAGDTVTVPIKVFDASNVEINKLSNIKTSLRLDAGLLEPVDGTPTGIIDNGDRIINLDLTPFIQSDSILIKYKFLVKWSLKDSTDLIIENSAAKDKPVIISEKKGEFTLGCDVIRHLTDECESMRLYQSIPNPVTGMTKIDYDIFSSDEIQLTLFNLKAQQVLLLDKGKKEAGRYEVSFDASILPVGAYIYVLQNSSCKLNGKLEADK